MNKKLTMMTIPTTSLAYEFTNTFIYMSTTITSKYPLNGGYIQLTFSHTVNY